MKFFYENKKTGERIPAPQVQGYEQEGGAFAAFLMVRAAADSLQKAVEEIRCEEGSNKYNKSAKKWLDGFTGGWDFYSWEFWRDGDRDRTSNGYKTRPNVVAEATLRNGEIWGYIADEKAADDTPETAEIGEHKGDETPFNLAAALKWAEEQAGGKASTADMSRLRQNLLSDNRGRPVPESQRKALDAYGVVINWLAKFLHRLPHSKTEKAEYRGRFYAALYAAAKDAPKIPAGMTREEWERRQAVLRAAQGK